jgi:hypothetical protein
MSTCKFLRRKAASDYLRETHGLERAPSTLAKLAVIGGGPVFRRAGRIPLYSPEELDCWAASLLSAPMRSTSESAPPKQNMSDRCEQIADPCGAPRQKVTTAKIERSRTQERKREH